MIHADWQGEKWVAVGSKVLHSDKWKTPIDFLFDFPRQVFSRRWGKAELNKPLASRHPLMQWFDSTCRLQGAQSFGADGLYAMEPNGAARCYLLLAYDLYTLEHHGALPKDLVRRLRMAEQFQGARHEVFAAATCIRAGYSIEYENLKDGKKHVEFIATHRHSGQNIAVEAKSKHRPGLLGYPGERIPDDELRLNIRGLVKDALEKPVSYPYVIFLDLNLPPNSAAPLTSEWLQTIGGPIITEFGGSDGRDPWNLILFSNIPNHYDADSTPSSAGYVVGVLGRKPTIPEQFPEGLQQVFDAALKFGNLPNSFAELG